MRHITASQFQQGLLQQSLHGLDVRTDEELNLAAIAGVQSIGLHLLGARHTELPRDKPIAVICHHGMRSQTAAAFLEQCGFSDVMNVLGGIDAYSTEVDPRIARY